MRRISHVRTGLSAPALVAGVEERLFVMNFGIAAVLMVGPKFYWYPVVALLLHFFLRGVSKKEHLAAKIYLRFAMQADVYTPWPVALQKRGMRPNGFARNERLM